MAVKPDADLLTRLAAQAVECRALIREMHEAQHDLRAATREAAAVVVELRRAVDEQVERDVGAIILDETRRRLDEYGETIQLAMANTARKISREFDTLTEPMFKTLGLMDVAIERHTGETVERER